MSVDFSKKSLVFITGASRGIGRAIAVEISRISNVHSTLVLIASSSQGLDETKSLIAQVNAALNVITFPLDLSTPTFASYGKLFDDVLNKIDHSELKFSIFIHNAGTIGILKQSLDLSDEDKWRKYYDLNVVSAVTLNTNFVKKVRNLAEKLVVINISSLCGKVPFVNMSMYCSGKAARELFFKVFALEEPEILVLNYSPGPVDTDMFNSVAETAQSETLRNSFKETKKTAVLTTLQTVEKFLGILQKGDFKSGDSLDYYDRF